jgi:hypothetical protein
MLSHFHLSIAVKVKKGIFLSTFFILKMAFVDAGNVSPRFVGISVKLHARI